MISCVGRRVMIGLIVGCVIALTTVPAGVAQQEITIYGSTASSDWKSIVPLVERFEKQTGIKVKVEGGRHWKEPLMTAFAAGSARYDAILGFPYDTDFEDAGFIIPLDGSYDPKIKIPDNLLQDILPSVRKYLTYKGKMHWLPYSTDTTMLVYRTDLIEEAGFPGPPVSWYDLVAYGMKLTKDTNGDGVPDIWGYAYYFKPTSGNADLTFKQFLWNNGGEFTDETGRLVFDSQQGIEALKFLLDLRGKYRIVPWGVTTMDEDDIEALFKAGKYAMMNSFPKLWGACNREGHPLNGKVEVDFHPYSVRPASRVAGGAWAIPVTSKKKHLAWKFIQFMASFESQKFMQLMGLDYSALRSIYFDQEIRQKQPRRRHFYDVYTKMLEYGIPVPKFRGKGEVDALLNKILDQIAAGTMSVEEGLKKAAAEGNKIIERYR